MRVRAALALLVHYESVQARLTHRRLERVLTIDAEVADLTHQIARLVAETGTTLAQFCGLGPLVAARLLATVVDVSRHPNRDTGASANGTVPLAASSGRTVRHRFNSGGNRQLNRALFTVALTLIRGNADGWAYYQRNAPREDRSGGAALPQAPAL